MLQHKLTYRSTRLILFLFSFWAIGVILALFWGLGWFFLLESLRRLITYIPPLNRKIKEIFLGREEQMTPEQPLANPGLVTISRALGIIIMMVWIGFTIFVFVKMNIPLIDIIDRMKPK